MSLLWKRAAVTAADLIPSRLPSNAALTVTRDESLRASVKWAALRLRSDLVSTMPVDVFRKRPDGLMIPVTTPSVLTEPAGDWDWSDWAFQTQWDLDDVGNCFGLITAVDGNGRPARIEPVAAEKVSIRVKGDVVTYLVDGEEIGRAHV